LRRPTPNVTRLNRSRTRRRKLQPESHFKNKTINNFCDFINWHSMKRKKPFLFRFCRNSLKKELKKLKHNAIW
jgi:hypothetical protein